MNEKDAKKRRGVRIYKVQDEKGAKWQRHDIDPGGVAVEDMTAGDLNGDGRLAIVAVGRLARDAQAALQLVLAQPAISSQLVDNLNASIHLRALLTDLFLIDEIFKNRR